MLARTRSSPESKQTPPSHLSSRSPGRPATAPRRRGASGPRPRGRPTRLLLAVPPTAGPRRSSSPRRASGATRAPLTRTRACRSSSSAGSRESSSLATRRRSRHFSNRGTSTESTGGSRPRRAGAAARGPCARPAPGAPPLWLSRRARCGSRPARTARCRLRESRPARGILCGRRAPKHRSRTASPGDSRARARPRAPWTGSSCPPGNLTARCPGCGRRPCPA
mmetsp:Transcript_21003/g.54735  ORF Transcript_21003/g.54735 Transcript_21003/m.54735 type:complete len:223 (-) Transcript_21003:213-881(-)